MARKPMTEARAEMAMRQVEMARRIPDAFLTLDAIILLTGDSAPTIYRHAKAGLFPRPILPGKWHGGQVLECLARTVSAAAAQG